MEFDARDESSKRVLDGCHVANNLDGEERSSWSLRQEGWLGDGMYKMGSHCWLVERASFDSVKISEWVPNT